MANQPFFSIIMPVYGVEQYLTCVVHSVTAQTFSDFELILVDDCSPDRCPAMCDELAAADPRIRVIHKPQNEGLGMARNTGIQAVRGEFVLFMDSDDTIRPDTLQIVRDGLDDQTDLLVFGMQRIYENKDGQIIRVEDLPCTDGTMSNGEAFVALTQAHLFPFVCNKAYRRSFLQQTGVTFETTKLIEDFLFNIAIFAKTPRITTVPDCLYGYRKPAHQTLVNTYSPQFYELAKRKYHLERAFLETIGYAIDAAQQTVCFSHIKHLISVFLRNRSADAALSGKQQRRLIRDALNDTETREVLAEYHPCGLVQKTLCFVLKHKMTTVCYLAVCAADLVKGRGR